MSEAREENNKKLTVTPIDLCKFLGIDPDKTLSLVVEIRPSDENIYYRHEGKF